jgi:DNA-binding CsgD family transcriptional regulator
VVAQADLREVLDVLPALVGLLDAHGKVVWANASWLDRVAGTSPGIFEGARVGTGFLPGRPGSDPGRDAIAAGIRSLLAGSATRFETELSDPGSAWRITALAMSRGRCAVIAEPLSTSQGTSAGPRPSELTDVALELGDTEGLSVEPLTPRERDVLALMLRGLDNRRIATELDVGYTTVREHVRSLIAKFAATSRLEVVARVYQARGAHVDDGTGGLEETA